MTGSVSHRQRLETLGLLATGVVHDVNNLLTVIANYAGLALEPRQDEAPDAPLDPDRWRRLRWDIEQIHRTARRGSELTRRVLSYASPDAENPAQVSVNDLIRETLALLKGAMWRRVEVSTDLDPNCQLVTADPVRLRQALVNLAVNARDAMPDGGRMAIRTSNTEHDQRWFVRVEVADTGDGIPAELLDRVFEPFFSTKGADAGTGLGLTIVREFLTEIGGMVRVESTPGCGTRFELLLPALGHHSDEAGRVAVATGFVRTQDAPAAR